MSCYTDHVRAWTRAQNVTAQIVPNYPNMFSELATHPPKHYSVKVHPLDPTLGQNRYAPVDTDPKVTGANRFRYFRKPLIPYTDNPGG